MISHSEQWDFLQTAILKQRLSQALLFVGPLHCDLASWTTSCIQSILCQTRCNQCPDCQMISTHAHPDLEWVKPEQAAIKVDQIRGLQQRAYLTPARGKHRFIVLEGAEKMNKAAANALLKVLEEPSDQTIFILIAEQIGSMLPTILSRCQRLVFTSNEKSYQDNFLLLTHCYPKESPQSALGQASAVILEGLIALCEQREHACFVASTWISQFEWPALLWFLYLVYAQLQQMNFGLSKPDDALLQRLSSLSSPEVVFSKLDKLMNLQRQLYRQISINPSLALEDLLLF